MDLKKWFLSFARSYLSGNDEKDRAVELKIDHTLRVVDNVKWLLSDDIRRSYDGHEFIDDDTAIMTAYLHDIGRFEQYRRYGTFDDRTSIDHGDLSASMAGKLDFVRSLDDRRRNMVITAVRLHNKKTLSDDIPEYILVHCRILRDADKMDIFRILAGLYTQGYRYGLSSSLLQDVAVSDDIGDDVLNEFLNGQLVSFSRVRTVEELQLLRLSWIYDFSSPYPLIHIWEKGYLRTIIEALNEEHRELIASIVEREIEKQKERINKYGI